MTLVGLALSFDGNNKNKYKCYAFSLYNITFTMLYPRSVLPRY